MNEENDIIKNLITAAERIVEVRKLNLSPLYCPRCNKKSINKLNRRCEECKGRVIWTNCDDAKYFIENHFGWYGWHKSIFNLTGWYEMSYWGIKYY